MIEGVQQVEQRLPLAEVDILTSLPSKEIERLSLRSASVHLGVAETFALEEEQRALLMVVSGREFTSHTPGARASPSPWSSTRPSSR